MAELAGYDADEPAHAKPMTAQELVQRCPGIEPEIEDVRLWMKGDVALRIASVPMGRFAETALHLRDTYPEFPKERRRTDRILAELRRGEAAWPVFVDEEDGFILEGRHRIVALFEERRETVEVAFVRSAGNQKQSN